ncbi:DNA recombination protein RmuC [Blattabacterium cuenoti]|uniref:DNA recombination protein RmuC n=1 Tax=Blattabacterium cuenoti TaxID=1653831 RepID=UPI00163BAF0F|nr:DNA recombination protein RmuC [Blattabacterium cuenoti]
MFIKEEYRNQKSNIKDINEYNKDYIIDYLNDFRKEWINYSNNYQNFLSKEIQLNFENYSNKLDSINVEQKKFVENIEKNIENIKEVITSKLQKSLNYHLEKSFEVIGNQLIFLQKGLGEMKILVKDVSSLKRTLNNVKICGSFSEMQLSMLLEQILSPDQYDSNVITKSNTNYVVEFAIKLPGFGNGSIWLPIDVKFPKETYEKVQLAYRNGDKKSINIATKNMESVLKKMSKDIQHKYIDPPNTTDFAILFLPFEGIYAEVIKNSKLLEELLRKYNTVVSGPSTLAAILNSLQIGFRTLAIQKRTSEVWKILESVKQEFSKFGILLHQVQDKLQGASKDIDKLLGVKTNLIEKKLKNIDQ